MTTYQVAHYREQGVELAIIPLNDQFDYHTSQEQHEFHAALRARSVCRLSVSDRHSLAQSERHDELHRGAPATRLLCQYFI